jgi:hypothetical protein
VKALLPALILLAVAAPPASATPGFSLGLSQTSPAVVSHPVLVQATGKNPPPAEYGFTTWMEAVLLRPEVVGTCPFNAGNAGHLANATGGVTFFFAQRIDVDLDGRYSLPIGFTPNITGPLLLCAYTYNEAGFTHAQASLTVDVQRAASAARPRVKRSGRKLVCKGARGAYGWIVDGAPKPRAHRRALRITRALRGHHVACTITTGGATATSRPISVRR